MAGPSYQIAKAGLSFGRLCRLDPRLDRLRKHVEKYASKAGRRRRCCPNVAWVRPGGVRSRLLALVGPARVPAGVSDPDTERVMTTPTALELAAAELRARLPECRGCSCSPSDWEAPRRPQ